MGCRKKDATTPYIIESFVASIFLGKKEGADELNERRRTATICLTLYFSLKGFFALVKKHDFAKFVVFGLLQATRGRNISRAMSIG